MHLFRGRLREPVDPRPQSPLSPSGSNYRQPVDTVMPTESFEIDKYDFIIIVMGPTGSGKTNFINKLTGTSEKEAARDLESDTQDVTPYPIRHESLRLVLVDTPGFDDTYRPDIETLQVIADWLVQKYPDGNTLKIAGIIYLHKITDNRLTGSALRNLEVFGKLCGITPLPRTRLVTTMWDEVTNRGTAERRETQLTDGFWHGLIKGGASVQRFDNTLCSARNIVNNLLPMGNDCDALLLQEELDKQKKRLNETQAGKVLYQQLLMICEKRKQTLKGLAENAKLQKNPVLAKDLQEEHDKIDMELQRLFQEMKGLKIPLSRQISLWLLKIKFRTA